MIMWKKFRTWFKCFWDDHDWEEVSRDVGHCLRCGVELKTAEMDSFDLNAFNARYRSHYRHARGVRDGL